MKQSIYTLFMALVMMTMSPLRTWAIAWNLDHDYTFDSSCELEYIKVTSPCTVIIEEGVTVTCTTQDGIVIEAGKLINYGTIKFIPDEDNYIGHVTIKENYGLSNFGVIDGDVYPGDDVTWFNYGTVYGDAAGSIATCQHSSTTTLAQNVTATCTQGGGTKSRCNDCWYIFYSEPEAHDVPETFTDGIKTCSKCGHEEYQQPSKDTDNKTYLLANTGNLYWFSDFVNTCVTDEDSNITYPNLSACARLTANIVVNDGTFADDGTFTATGEAEASTPRVWKPIGPNLYTFLYTGTFDGDGHTISGLYCNNVQESNYGLFRYCGSDAIVKKVGVSNCYFNCGYGGIAAICYQNLGEISYCHSSGIISSTEKDNAGLCNINKGYIGNCYSTCSISAERSASGICYANYGIIENCYFAGSLSNAKDLNGICRLNATQNGSTCMITNCYTTWATTIGDNREGTTVRCVEGGVGTDRFASGEIAYRLNGTVDDQGTWSDTNNGTKVWYQRLGEGGDTTPVLKKASDGSSNIYYSRTMRNTWETLVLPFDVAITANDYYDFYSITGVDYMRLQVAKLTGTLAAGTPVLIRKKVKGDYDLTLTGTYVGTTIHNPAPVAGLTFTGTFTKITVAEGAGYEMEGGDFDLIDDEATIDPYHAYLAGAISGQNTLTPKPIIALNATTALEDCDISTTTYYGYLVPPTDTEGNKQSGYFTVEFSKDLTAVFLLKIVNGQIDLTGIVATGTDGKLEAHIEGSETYALVAAAQTQPTGVTMTTQFLPDQVITNAFSTTKHIYFTVPADGSYTITSSDQELNLVVLPYIEVGDGEEINYIEYIDQFIGVGEGTVSCTLTKGTTYTLGTKAKKDNVNITIQRVPKPVELPALQVGENTITLSQLTDYNPQYAFTAAQSGDYTFTLSKSDERTVMALLSTSTFDYSKILALSNEGPTMQAAGLTADTEYYILVGVEGSSSLAGQEVTLTVTYKGTKKAVYDSTNKTLTFAYDAEAYEGLTVMDITDTDIDEDIDEGSYPWQAETEAVTAMKQNVTTAVFDPSFADVAPETAKGWFKGYTGLTTIQGFENLNTYNNESTKDMFNGCTSLTSITLPNQWKTVGDRMFEGCTRLTTVAYTSLPHVSKEAFTGCDKLRTCTLALTDDSFVDPNTGFEPTLTSKPTYTRTGITNQWGTLMVPFEVAIDAENAPYDFYTLSSVTSEAITLTKITSKTLAIGTPVLIRMSEGAKNAETGKYDLTLTATDNIASGTLENSQSEAVNGLKLQGTYSQDRITQKSGYILANNAFWNIQTVKGDNQVYLSPFRAYLAGSIPAGAPDRLSIGTDDDVSALEAIDALTSGEAEYFDLNGRPLNDLQTGVNIVKRGGKSVKVIIK